MSRSALAAVTAAVAVLITLAILWVITGFTNGSFTQALKQPSFWVVEGSTIALTSLAVLAPGDESQPRSAIARVAARAAWTVAGAIAVGVLLAVATETPVFDVLGSIAFLIPAAIAIGVAILEAWPDDTDAHD